MSRTPLDMRIYRTTLGLLALLSASLAAGQTAAQSQAPPTGFYAAGIAALPQTSPKPSGWAIAATQISKANSTWLIAGNDYVLLKGAVTPVSFVGTAIEVKALTFGTLMGYAGAGGATLPGSTTGAFEGGGALVGKFSAKSSLSWLAGVVEIKANGGGSQTVVHVGIGASW